jgi:hypothetical protein
MDSELPDGPRLHESSSFESLYSERSSGGAVAGLKRVNSESDIMSTNQNTTANWTCGLCQYENVSQKRVCVLCGTKRAQQSNTIAPTITKLLSATPLPPKLEQRSQQVSELSSRKGGLSLELEFDPPPNISRESGGGGGFWSLDQATNANTDQKEENPSSLVVVQDPSRSTSMHVEQPPSFKKTAANPITLELLDLSDPPVQEHSNLEQNTNTVPISNPPLSSSDREALFHPSSLLSLSTSDDVPDSKASFTSSSATLNVTNATHHAVSEKSSNQGYFHEEDEDYNSLDQSQEDISLDYLYAMGSMPRGTEASKKLESESDALHRKEDSSIFVPRGTSPTPAATARISDEQFSGIVGWEEGPPKTTCTPAASPIMASNDVFRDDFNDHDDDVEAAQFSKNATAFKGISNASSGPPVSRRNRVRCLLFCALVLMIVILSVSITATRNNDNDDGSATTDQDATGPLFDSPTAAPVLTDSPAVESSSPPSDGGGVKTESPVARPSPAAPTQSPVETPRPSSAPITVNSPTPLPTTLPPALPTNVPSSSPTGLPSMQPTDVLTSDFERVAELGFLVGDRFGTITALNDKGDLLLAASRGEEDPIRVFSIDNATGSWISLATVPWDSALFFNARNGLAIARSPENIPTIAIAVDLSFRVFEYFNDEWLPKGQDNMAWISPNSSIESAISFATVALSIDGSILAAGSLSESGESIVVRVFGFDSVTRRWEPRGSPIVRMAGAIPFLSSTLSLSGNGQVIAVSSWLLSNPAVTVQTYEWISSDWEAKGSELSYSTGPSALALSEDGQRLGVTTRFGISRIYEWKSNDDWSQMGFDIVGGSSIDMTRGGLRVLIGRPVFDEVWVVDFENGIWNAKPPLSGEASSQFGSSVSMSSDGNTLAVGSPLDDGSGVNAGRVHIFQ